MRQILTTASLAALLASAALADDWPQWNGPARNGISSEKGLLKAWPAGGPKALWEVDGLGEGYAGVSVAGGRIATTGNLPDGQAVLLLEAATGKLLWKTLLTTKAPDHGYPGARCTPSLDGDFLYATRSDGGIVCLKLSDGSKVWEKDFRKEWGGKMMSGWGFSESPLVDGDRVLCTPGGPDAMIVALKKADGAEIWKSATPDFGAEEGAGGGRRKDLKDGAGYASIVIGNACGEKQYVALVGRGAIGVRASDGKFLWRYKSPANGTANCSDPVVSGDFVFAGSAYGNGGGLARIKKDGDAWSAEEVYFAKSMENHHGGMVKVGEHLYGFGSGGLLCLEYATGKEAWKDRSVRKGSLIAADGMLYLLGEGHEMALAEATPEGYKEHGRFPVEKIGKHASWSHPTVSGGVLYLRNQGKLTAYDVRAR